VSKRDVSEQALEKNLLAAARADSTTLEEELAWVTTKLFYAVVQAAEMELASYPDDECLGQTDHARRLCRIQRHWPGDAATLYGDLQQYSTEWRYFGVAGSKKVRKKAWRKVRRFFDAIGATWPSAVAEPA
jgi:hypothetical protein